MLIAGIVTPAWSGDMVISHFAQGAVTLDGWQWQGFADTVMGGRSTLESPGLVNTEYGPALRLAGQVVTRGGGFIQVRLQNQGIFNADAFRGVEVELRARRAGSYYVFARTRDNSFPWSYYGAPLQLSQEKQVIQILWSDFQGQATLRRTIRPHLLTSLALVAAYEDFQADLEIFRVGLFQ